MTGTLANGYSSESAQRELSNEYHYDRVWVVFKNLCLPVVWTKVVSALEGYYLVCAPEPPGRSAEEAIALFLARSR